MDINRKIEEIRKKPEHIRMRYVWGAVALCMSFIFIIWIFSLHETFKSSGAKEGNLPSIKDDINQQKQSIPSLKDFINESNKSSGENGSQGNSPSPGSNSGQEGVLKQDIQNQSDSSDGANMNNSDASDESTYNNGSDGQ